MSVFQVVADGLPAEFPVLRSVDDFAGNLPRQLSSLVGRERCVDDVAELVRSNRLVTLTGVGGVGKTRLALEVGAELAGEFPDGVWLVELAGGRRPGRRCPPPLATVLGITPQGDAPLIDTVADTLAGRRLLLVIDNCEHVLGAAASAIDGDPRPTRARRGSSPRRARPLGGRRRDRSLSRVAAGGRRRRDVRRRHAVRRPGPRRPARLRARRSRRPRRR